MPNAPIAELIADNLGSGLPHPGKPEHNESPRLLPLVAFRTAGMAPEMVQHVQNTAQCVGEAVVNLIETAGRSVIIERTELDALRAAEDSPGDSLAIVCRLCKNPMAHFRVISGRALVLPDVIRNIDPVCPHNMEATP